MTRRRRATGAALRLADGSERPVLHTLTVGRGEGNNIRLRAPSVSRRHAVLVESDGAWYIEDRGSANGTFLNGRRVPLGTPHPLRHGDRIALGSAELVFSWPAEAADPERTEQLDEAVAAEPAAQHPPPALSPLQLRIVRALCGAWLGEPVGRMPSNRQIAAQLGTPEAEESVKAALRRIYAKLGISGMPAHLKRRELCRAGRRHGWL